MMLTLILTAMMTRKDLLRPKAKQLSSYVSCSNLKRLIKEPPASKGKQHLNPSVKIRKVVLQESVQLVDLDILLSNQEIDIWVKVRVMYSRQVSMSPTLISSSIQDF